MIEAFGPPTSEELNEVLGARRLRDLESRQLRPLEEMGLLRVREGRWELPDDYPERIEAIADEEYTTTFRRRVRHQDGVRKVCKVEENTVTASERQRDADREHRQEKERAEYHLQREETAEKERRIEQGRREVLNRLDEEHKEGWIENEYETQKREST